MKQKVLKRPPKFKLKIIATLLCLLVVLLLISTAVVSVMMTRSITKDAIEVGNNTAAQLKLSVEQILSVMNNSLTQMALDSEVQVFCDRLELLDIFDCEAIYDRLYQFRATNKYIEKLYICYYQDGMVMDLNGSNGRLLPLEEMADRDLIERAVARCLDERMLKLITIFNLAPQDQDTLLVATKAAPPMAQVPRAVIVVTVRQSYFQELLQAITLDDACKVYVLDANGRFLFGKESEQPVFSATQDAFAPEGGENGYVTSVTHSDDTGWDFIYRTPVQQIHSRTSRFVLSLWLFSAAMLLGAGIGVRYLTRSLYKPVENVISSISDEDAPAMEDNDEISYINKRFKTLTAEKRHAEELLEENLPLLREDVLYQLLNREDSQEAALLKRMERCGVVFLKNAWYSATILAIHGFDRLSPEEDADTALLLELEAIRDTASRFESCALEFIRTQQGGKLVILFSVREPDRTCAAAVLRGVQDEIFRRVSADTGTEITVAAGNPYHMLGFVWQSYKEASAAYRYRAIAGSHGVIYADQLPAVRASSLERFSKLERTLFDALKRSDGAALSACMEELFVHIQSELPVSYTPAFVSVQLFNDTMNLMQELSIDSTLIFPNLDELFAQVLTLRTPEQLRRFFTELYGAISGYITLLKQEGRGDVFEAMLTFLNENYRSEEIGLDLLASELHFSVSYLVRVFKNATGKSIKEYITQRRIVHAKALLECGGVKVNDVARQVGYPNVRSFINIFKKQIGLTPGEYMNLSLRGKE